MQWTERLGADVDFSDPRIEDIGSIVCIERSTTGLWISPSSIGSTRNKRFALSTLPFFTTCLEGEMAMHLRCDGDLEDYDSSALSELLLLLNQFGGSVLQDPGKP